MLAEACLQTERWHRSENAQPRRVQVRNSNRASISGPPVLTQLCKCAAVDIG